MVTPQIIYQSEFLRATLHKSANGSGKLMCNFDYLESHKTGFPDIRKSPSMCARGYDVLTIDSSRNDWFLSNDVDALGNVLGMLSQNYDRSTSLCFSMGIMGALMFLDQLRLQNIMAFSPVVSIFGDDIPDHRFKKFRKHVTCPEYRDRWKDTTKDINGVLCFDPYVTLDAPQARLIHEYYPCLKPVALPFGWHPSTQIIREGLGVDAIYDLINKDDFTPTGIRTLHTNARLKSDKYKKSLHEKRNISI
jgi:hypothetical protein